MHHHDHRTTESHHLVLLVHFNAQLASRCSKLHFYFFLIKNVRDKDDCTSECRTLCKCFYYMIRFVS